jgi:phosphatidylglycerol:prolipoprotein diacylglycerol transferase
MQIGQTLVPVLGVMLGCGIIVLTFFSAFQGAHFGLGRRIPAGAILIGLIAGTCGAAVAEWLTDGSVPGHITSGGMAGCLLAAAVSVKAWAAARRVPLLRLADCLSAPLALGVVLVRIGCFLAGCDFGKPTDQVWGVTFRSGVALAWYGTPLGVPLHPTQLYESALAGGIFGLLVWLRRRHPPEGTMFYAFVSIYAVGRFFIEFLRGDPGRGFLGPLSVPQWQCMIVFLAAALLYIRGFQFSEASPRGQGSPPIRQLRRRQRSAPR